MPVTGEPGAGADQGVILVTTAHWPGLGWRGERMLSGTSQYLAGWVRSHYTEHRQTRAAPGYIHQAWYIVVGKYI